MNQICTSDEAVAALGYLRHAFGGYTIPDAEERAHLRLFRTCTVAELRVAIDALVRTSDRRPSPNDVAQMVRKLRPQARVQPEAEPWPEIDPDAVRRHIDECRRILAEKGVRT